MKTTIKRIFSNETKWGHLTFLLAATVLGTAFLYIFVIPVVFWSIYGAGASSERIDRLPLAIFISEWLPLIVALIFLWFSSGRSVRNGNLSAAKSYLCIIPLLLLLYLLRMPILDVMFTIFQ